MLGQAIFGHALFGHAIAAGCRLQCATLQAQALAIALRTDPPCRCAQRVDRHDGVATGEHA